MSRRKNKYCKGCDIILMDTPVRSCFSNKGVYMFNIIAKDYNTRSIKDYKLCIQCYNENK